jgi:putative hydrolase
MSVPGKPEQPDQPGDDDALLRFLAQFGITPDAEGRLDPDQLLDRMQSMLSAFNTQLAGFGAADAASGMNWGFTLDLVRRATAAVGPDPEPSEAVKARIRDAVGLADLWLDEAISFDRLPSPAAAWRRADWVEQSFGTWQRLMRPVINQLSVALQGLGAGAEQPAGVDQMMRLAVASMFGGRVSQTLSTLAAAVLSGSDSGLPTTDQAHVALIPVNIDAFGEGLAASGDDLLLYLAIRETARQRLFGAVAWLGPQLLALVEHYAREITIDADSLAEAIEAQLDSVTNAADLERAGEAVAHSLFAPQRTAEQVEVLARLENLLALVEGWVDEVTAQVTEPRMPAATPLTEMVRRRRASGGPAETALRDLVGLELRPRRTRDAANLWAATRNARGIDGRDAVWAHPDLVPDASALDDPIGFASADRSDPTPDALDDELAKLLDQESGSDQD